MNNRYDTVPEAFGVALNPNSVAALPPVNREQAERVASLIVSKFWPKHVPLPPLHYGTYRRSDPRWVRRVWLSKLPTTRANSAKGLGRLVHDLSHDVFAATYPHKRAHDPLHVRYEIDIAAFVGTNARVRAFLTPKAKAEKPAQTIEQKRELELHRTNEAIVRWERKAKRAINALKKLHRKRARLLRIMI